MGTRAPEKPRASLALRLSQTGSPAPAPHFFRTLSADRLPVPKSEPPAVTPQHVCASVCTGCTDTQGGGAAEGLTEGPPAGPLRNLSSAHTWASPAAPGCSSQLPLLQPGDTAAPLGDPSRTGLSFRGAAAVWKPSPGVQTSRAKARWTAGTQGPARASLHPSGPGAQPFTPAQKPARVRRPVRLPDCLLTPTGL